MSAFRKTYFFIFLLIFITEVLIALYIHDQIIRPYVGDVLVVILIYCFVQSFFKLQVFPCAIAVLLFSYFIETLQYFNIVHHLGLGDSRLANTVIGNYFTWVDIAAYTLGIIIVLVVERIKKSKLKQTSSSDQLWLFL